MMSQKNINKLVKSAAKLRLNIAKHARSGMTKLKTSNSQQGYNKTKYHSKYFVGELKAILQVRKKDSV